MISKKALRILKKTDSQAWIAGAAGGVSGQVVLGLGEIGWQMYRSGGLNTSHQIVDWVPQIATGLVLGLLFAVIVSNTSMAVSGPMVGAAIGFGYGLLTWVVPLPVVAFIGLELIGLSNISDVQLLMVDDLGRQAVYGSVLGTVYSLLRNAETTDALLS